MVSTKDLWNKNCICYVSKAFVQHDLLWLLPNIAVGYVFCFRLALGLPKLSPNSPKHIQDSSLQFLQKVNKWTTWLHDVIENNNHNTYFWYFFGLDSGFWTCPAGSREKIAHRIRTWRQKYTIFAFRGPRLGKAYRRQFNFPFCFIGS